MSEKTITITVPGKPQPKQRARRGKGGHWYTPKATKRYERTVRFLALDAVGHFNRCNSTPWPLDARYRMTTVLYMPDRRRRDADNVVKALQDALNGVVYDDDSQIIESVTRKDLDRDEPRADIVLEVIE